MEQVLNAKYLEICQNPSQFPTESRWIAKPTLASNRGIKFCMFMGVSGYSNAGKNYVISLFDQGFYVYVQPVRYYLEKSPSLVTDADNVLAVAINNKDIKYDHVIIHAPPSRWTKIVMAERIKNSNVRIYGLTVWETDRVDDKWMDLVDRSGIDALIVPSNWNLDTFKRSSDRLSMKQFPPVFACHHVITDLPSNPNGLSRAEFFGQDCALALLCIGTWSPRKGIDETVEACVTAFRDNSDVVLYLKTSIEEYSEQSAQIINEKLDEIKARCGVSDSCKLKIVLDTSMRSDEYIENLTNQCDVFVSLCNSEGVGLGACYAALKGKMIVMTGFGGQKEYIKESYWIDYKLEEVNVPPDFVHWIRPPQKWAYPEISHAVKLLREVYDLRGSETLALKSKENREFILKNFSTKAIGEKFQKIIDKVTSLPKLVSTSMISAGFWSDKPKPSRYGPTSASVVPPPPTPEPTPTPAQVPVLAPVRNVETKSDRPIVKMEDRNKTREVGREYDRDREKVRADTRDRDRDKKRDNDVRKDRDKVKDRDRIKTTDDGKTKERDKKQDESKAKRQDKLPNESKTKERDKKQDDSKAKVRDKKQDDSKAKVRDKKQDDDKRPNRKK